MKGILIVIAFLALYDVASGLQCYTCDRQADNTACFTPMNYTISCNGSDQCLSFKMPLTNKVSKGCGSNAVCDLISFVNKIGISLAYCCTTDQCNVNAAPGRPEGAFAAPGALGALALVTMLVTRTISGAEGV